MPNHTNKKMYGSIFKIEPTGECKFAQGIFPSPFPLPRWGEGRVRGCHTEGRLSFIASRIIMGNKKTPETSKTFEELPFQK